MKEHPIIFSTDMVKASLDGRKTQTRRVIKPQPYELRHHWVWAYKKGQLATDHYWLGHCPYGQIGDRLWVRETWDDETGTVLYKVDCSQLEAKEYAFGWKSPIFMPRWASRITLEITEIRVERLQEITIEDILAEGSRYPVTPEGNLVLRITGKFPPSDYISKENYIKGKYIGNEELWIRAHFASLWDSLNAKRGYSWESNPWVWVISFRKLSG